MFAKSSAAVEDERSIAVSMIAQSTACCLLPFVVLDMSTQEAVVLRYESVGDGEGGRKLFCACVRLGACDATRAVAPPACCPPASLLPLLAGIKLARDLHHS